MIEKQQQFKTLLTRITNFDRKLHFTGSHIQCRNERGNFTPLPY